LPFAGALGEIDRVFLERLALAFGFLRVDAGAAAHRFDRRLERLARETCLPQQTTGLALVVAAASRKSSLAMNWSPRLGGFLVGEVQQVVEVARHGDFAAQPLDLREPLDRLLDELLQLRDGDPGAGEERRRAAVFLIEHRRQQVRRLDGAVVAAERQALRVGRAPAGIWSSVFRSACSCPWPVRRVSDGGARGRFKRKASRERRARSFAAPAICW
jgi:hypothetical protein